MSFERGDHVELAEALVKELGEADVVGDEGVIWHYVEARGLYSEVEGTSQSRIVQSFAGRPSGPKGEPLRLKATDVGGVLKLAYDRVATPGFFASAPAGIAFANGFAVVTADGIDLQSHSRDHRARYGYPFDYPGNVPSLLHLQFLDALFRDDIDKCEKVSLWQEFGGACLLGIAPIYQRCVVGVGDGDNGKSKKGEILVAVMPEGSTCAIAPQEFEQEYRRAQLAGKRLNIVSELPEAEILNSESFKAIVSGDSITGRHIRQAPFTFRPVAGHYFAANKLPGTNDHTAGFWRRFIVETFNRSFTNDPARNPRIAEEIIATERPAIVSWFLQGAVRMLQQREYTIPSSHEAALSGWRRSADPVALYVEEATTPCDPSEGTAASWLYGNFRGWSERNGHRVMSSTKFGMRMKDLGKSSQHTREGYLYPVKVTRCDDNPSQNYQRKSNGYN